MARHPYEHSLQQKAKARKSGPSLRRKTEELAELANTFASTVYWDPTHRCYRITTCAPEGWEIPDLNSLVADELAGHASPPKRGRGRRITQLGRPRRQPPLPRGRKQRGHRRGARPANTDMYEFRESSEEPIEPGSGQRRSPAGSLHEHDFTDNGNVGTLKNEEIAQGFGKGSSKSTVLSHGISHSDDGVLSDDDMMENARTSGSGRSTAETEQNFSAHFGGVGDVVVVADSPTAILDKGKQCDEIAKEQSLVRPMGQAWGRLVRDSLNLLDGLLSQQPITFCPSGVRHID